MSNTVDWTLIEAAARISAKEISSRELTEILLSRAEASQPVLNAFIRFDRERALDTAAKADAALAGGKLSGPLAGVPLAHKDMFYRQGAIATCGSKIRRDFVPAITSTVLARLDAAGAVGLGGLNMSEFALGPSGLNAHYGRACNPWNPAFISGGSSSGSGAAVSAGLVYGALGSDTGGSIRLPAAMCGCVGLKPTRGRVSLYGAMGLSFSLDCVGPLARTAADAALLYETIAGPDPNDPYCATRPVQRINFSKTDIAGIKVGIPDMSGLGSIDPEVEKYFARAAICLQEMGCRLISLPSFEADMFGELTNIVAMAEAAALHMDWLRDRPEDYGEQVRVRLLQGLVVPGPVYIRALQLRPVLLKKFEDEMFSACDILCMPAAAGLTPTFASVDVGADPSLPSIVASLTSLVRPISYLGLPALSQPIGYSNGGLPVAMQLVAPLFQEAALLELAMAFERSTDGAYNKVAPKCW